MRHILVVLALIAMASLCRSQDLPDYSSKTNEFNIGYFNLFNLMGTNEFGVGYKRSGEHGAFRMGTGFSFFLSSSESDREQDWQKGLDISPRMGYEFHQWFNRFRVHYGAEAVSSFHINKSERTTDDPEYIQGDTYKRTSYGFRPLIGVTFYINPSISIATEACLDIQWSKTVDEDLWVGGPTVITNTGVSTTPGPLGIVSVNFHF